MSNPNEQARTPQTPLADAGQNGRFMDFEEKLHELFTYHSPDSDQLVHYDNIRRAAKYFATVIVMHTPPGADQTAAVRKIREAVMTANASIALRGLSF